MKLLLLIEMITVLWTVPALAADDVTTRAMKLYQMHHYEEAARMLRPALAGMDVRQQPSANLALGMIYLESSTLYRELYETALMIENDYLKLLSKQKTATPSRFVDLYLGQTYLELGNAESAAIHLRRFVQKQKNQSSTQDWGRIELGIAYSNQKQSQKAKSEWATVNQKLPETKVALAGAYAKSGMSLQQPILMSDTALQESKTQGQSPNMRMLRNLLRVYSDSGSVEKALDLPNMMPISDASYIEKLGSSKTISFYDSSLLDDLAKVHLRAAVMYLEQAEKDAKLADTARFYLARAYLQRGNSELSLRHSSSLLESTSLPVPYRNMALLTQAGAYMQSNRRAEANALWLSLAEKSTEDPALQANILLACANAGGDCGKLEKIALAIVEKGAGKKFFSLNAALGKNYLLQKNYSKAMVFLEAGRDKASKNKIEVNDPLLLVALAEAYYRNKNFSENLEIYFEFSGQFPVVRQIQEAMQGIYAMQQQSAGDVKIF